MSIWQIRITVAPTPAGFGFAARGFVDALNAMLGKRNGGSCVGVVDGGVITIETRNATAEVLNSLVDSYCSSHRKENRTVEVVIVENPATPLGDSALAAGALLNSAPTKLTRTFYMKLASGTFVASNLLKSGFEPVFAESVEDDAMRSSQWQRIKAAGADQRACHTFPTETHYRQWWQQQVEHFGSMRR